MTKFRGKSGSMLSTKRHALLGATALTLMAVSQNVYAGAPGPVTAVTALTNAGSPLAADTPVVDLLSVPLTQAATGFDPISVTNSEAISVSDTETGITLSGESGDVTLVNSGDISGAIGISVTTGTPTEFLYTYSFDSNPNRSIWAQDSYGNWYQKVQTYVVQHTRYQVLEADQSDAAIVVDNSGSISFSGTSGIQATNPTGASIEIANSGDISSTSTTDYRYGISASTLVPPAERTINQFVPGEYTTTTYPWGTYVTGVITPGYLELTSTYSLAYNDGGTIRIENSGTIDMGPVSPQVNSSLAERSIGIFAESPEGIDITNNGTVRVGDLSTGIKAMSAGNVVITNDGLIEIGNRSTGISSVAEPMTVDRYAKSGDVTIVNSGDIRGGMTIEEAQASENYDAFVYHYRIAGATGVYARSTNGQVGSAALEIEDVVNYYIDLATPEGEVPQHVTTYSDAYPNVHRYTTTLINEGDIELKGNSYGMLGIALYGQLNAENSGTIIVGSGAASSFAPVRSYGIRLKSYIDDHHYYAFADLYAHNGETGIIVTGDEGAGIALQAYLGSAKVVNEGSITVGSGGTPQNYSGQERVFVSYGIDARTMGYFYAQKASVINSGDVSVGDLGVGIGVRGYSLPGSGIGRVTAEIVNSGTVTAGNNSIGLSSRGNLVSVTNSGQVTIGDRDVSGYDPTRSAEAILDRMGSGIYAAGYYSAAVQNDGAITAGDGTKGISTKTLYHSLGYGAVVVQGADGIVTTGDNSIGIQAAGSLYTYVVNDGHVRTANNSVGIDVYGGGADSLVESVPVYTNPYTGHVYYDYVRHTNSTNPEQLNIINSGVIETGDNSVGVRLLGNRTAVATWSEYYLDPYTWEGGYRNYAEEVEITGAVYLANSGTIRVGANSTAVEITGERILVEQNGQEHLLPHLVNSGTIEAGAGGTALRINASPDIAPAAVDSYVVNLGTISGDIFFGDGDDELLNGQQLVDREPVTTGNIIMSGNTIDFGGGTNMFRIEGGVISVADGENAITGDNLTVQMTGAEIEARDAFIAGPATLALAATPFASSANFSTLTINGDVSGTFTFAADVGAGGESDELIITGNVADGSEIGVILNPVEQLKGSVEIRPINIGGTNGADVIEVAGVTGIYADSLLASEAHFDATTGDVVINATFGMGHMATATNAAATMTRNWWLQSVGSYQRRNPISLAKRDGLSIWSSAFHDVSVIEPANGLQDASFNQQLFGGQFGLSFTKEFGDASLSIGPMFTYGKSIAKLNANSSKATSNGWAYGVNGNVRYQDFYLDAVWQKVTMDVDLRTPETFSGATGATDAKGNGFNVEAGYAHKLKSGLTLTPQLQYAWVDVDLDDFASSDGAYDFTKIGSKASLLRAGMSISRTFESASGSITPLATLSFVDCMGGCDSNLRSNGVAFANDTKGAGFKLELGIDGAHKKWEFGVRTGIGDTSKSKPALSSSLTVGYRW